MELLQDHKKLFFAVFSAFFLFQLLSFLGYFAPSLSAVFFWLVIVSVFCLSLKKIDYGLYALCFEFLAGHEGHLFSFGFSFGGISLRLALFITVMAVWFLKFSPFQEGRERSPVQRDEATVGNRRCPKRGSGKIYFLKREKIKPSFFFSLFILFLLFGLVRGFLNNSVFAVKDFINYAYIFLALPLSTFLKDRQNQRNAYVIFKALIPAIFLLTLFVLILFSTGLVEVHDQFYWWWRGIVIGKATFAGYHFYRIVSSAHLLVLPLLLLCLSLWFASGKDEQWKRKSLALAIIVGTGTLLINFSRAYFLGFFAGLLFLAIGLEKKRWLKAVAVFLLIFIAEFVMLFTLTSGFKTMGFDLLGKRMGTLVSPEEELSSATRLMILPGLLEKIKEKPWGYGLGMEISYPDPVTKEMKKTRHLDWGWLEILAELGIFGFLSFLSLIISLFVKMKEKLKTAPYFTDKRITIGLGAGLTSLLISSITGPFIFHALGIFYLSLVIAYLSPESQEVNKI